MSSVEIPDSYANDKKQEKLEDNTKKKEKNKKFDIQAIEMPKNLIFQKSNLQRFLQKVIKHLIEK